MQFRSRLLNASLRNMVLVSMGIARVPSVNSLQATKVNAIVAGQTSVKPLRKRPLRPISHKTSTFSLVIRYMGQL